MPALAHDVDGDEDRQHRVEPQPAGRKRQNETGEHPGRRHHVGHDVLAVGDQRRRSGAASRADKDRREDAVDDRRKEIEPEAGARLGYRHLAAHQRRRRLAQDQERRQHDQHALQHGRHVFRLVMAERMVRVGRPLRIGVGREGRDGRDHVDDRFQRVRKQADRPGEDICNSLQPNRENGRSNRKPRKAGEH